MVVLETARLRLQPFTLADVDRLHRLWNEPGVRRYLWDDEAVPREQVKSMIEKSIALFERQGFGLWAVIHKSAEELIGFCGFWHFHEPPARELLYGIKESYWHQGLATEAARAMMSHGFRELSFDRIEASADTPHNASLRVMERLGMTFWKRERSRCRDTTYYAISCQEFDSLEKMTTELVKRD